MKRMGPAPPPTGGEATGGIEEGNRGDGAGLAAAAPVGVEEAKVCPWPRCVCNWKGGTV